MSELYLWTYVNPIFIAMSGPPSFFFYPPSCVMQGNYIEKEIGRGSRKVLAPLREACTHQSRIIDRRTDEDLVISTPSISKIHLTMLRTCFFLFLVGWNHHITLIIRWPVSAECCDAVFPYSFVIWFIASYDISIWPPVKDTSNLLPSINVIVKTCALSNWCWYFEVSTWDIDRIANKIKKFKATLSVN